MKCVFKHQGFLDIRGEDAAAIAGKACIVLPAFTSRGNLSIEGFCAANPSPEGTSWPDLVFTLDGKTVGRMQLGKEGAFQHTFDISESVGKKGLKLGFYFDYDRMWKVFSLVCRIHPGYRRRRRQMLRNMGHGVQFHKFVLDGRVLADFTHGASAFAQEFSVAELGLGMNITGFFQHEFGIGESARCCANAAKTAGIPIALNLANIGTQNTAGDEQWCDSYRKENPYPVNLLHLDPPQMKMIRDKRGAGYMKGHYNIGYWAWELPEFPDVWLPSFDHVDEVWVPSEFVRQSLLPKSPVPVLVMPHAIEFDLPEPAPRSKFNLPEKDFLFLVMYDFNSTQDRKNPQAVIKAFQAAFPNPTGVKLVLKTHGGEKNAEDFAALQETLKGSPGILLINQTLRHDELRQLQGMCDCFVSLHRSEGFGMALAECMYLGKPVIATNWSGNLQFMDAENSCLVNYELVELKKTCGPYKRGQHWAEPDPIHAAEWMKKIVEDKELYSRISHKAKATIVTDFSRAKIGGLYEKRLRALSPWL